MGGQEPPVKVTLTSHFTTFAKPTDRAAVVHGMKRKGLLVTVIEGSAQTAEGAEKRVGIAMQS